jgi:hypothetical protein
MLFRWTSLPVDLPDPSLIIRTGTPPACVDKTLLLHIQLLRLDSVKAFPTFVFLLQMFRACYPVFSRHKREEKKNH